MISSLQKKTYISITLLCTLFFIIMSALYFLNVFERYTTQLMILICINIILAVSLNITVGCLGQINLGHAGFMSIGAYATGLFLKTQIIKGPFSFIISIIISAILAMMIGIIIGIPALRLKGDYLAIITLAFGEIIRVIIEYFNFTGGAQGLSSIPRFKSFPIYLLICMLSVAFMYSLMTSRHGRVVLAIREDEIASSAVGINTTKAKVFAFALAAMFSGIAGSLYAQHTGLISARQFDYNFSINILVMVVLGGMGSFTGSVVSATVLTLLPEVLRGFDNYRMIVYALVLIIMMLFRPSGILGRKEMSIKNIIRFFEVRFGGIKNE